VVRSRKKGRLVFFSSGKKKIAAAEGGQFNKIKKLKEQKG
jgi:hypothetical protein